MRTALAVAAILLTLAIPAKAETTVVATIKPLHSLVAAVMDGAGTPDLLIPGTGSPHTFTLKPSDARMLSQARVVFWIGPGLETALEHPLETLAANATVEALATAPAITQRAFAGDHDHDHGKEDDGHKDEDRKQDDHADDDHDGHHHGPNDPHVWLDPENAKAMVAEIAATLSKAMPEHAETFAANAARTNAELEKLTEEVKALLEPVWFQPYLVFHDAYKHFEERFGLPGSEAISINPEIRPGAKRIAELRAEIVEDGFVCAFIEPQFNPSVAEVIIEGTDVRLATLDPLGSAIEAGPALYPTLIRDIATTLRTCLAG